MSTPKGGPTNAAAPSGTTTSTTSPSASGTEAKVDLPVTAELLASDVYGIFVAIFVLALTLFVLFTTGSILSVLVLWSVIALVVVVLVYYGFINIQALARKVEKEVPTPIIPSGGNPLVGSEVFHIRENQFTYDEAPAVCAAYGGELATLEQIIEAYNHGAEWCGYGWTAGGLALYPTQKRTWEDLQREIDPGKRTRCGRPGVNGGYMDPMLKFGVNCFGFKPKGDFTPPAPVPGTDMQKFDEMVNRFKEMLNTLKLSPFSRREWSGYDSTVGGAVKSVVEKFWAGGEQVKIPHFTQTFATPYGIVEGFENADSSVVERPTAMPYSASPVALRGELGPTGPAGPMGAASTIPGPMGPRGLMGEAGAPGAASTVAGPQGLQGVQGERGFKGDKGDKGEPGNVVGVSGIEGKKGERGERGDPGKVGQQGGVGPVGPVGPIGPQGVAGVAGPMGPTGIFPTDPTVSSLNIGGWKLAQSPATGDLQIFKPQYPADTVNIGSAGGGSSVYAKALGRQSGWV